MGNTIVLGNTFFFFFYWVSRPKLRLLVASAKVFSLSPELFPWSRECLCVHVCVVPWKPFQASSSSWSLSSVPFPGRGFPWWHYLSEAASFRSPVSLHVSSFHNSRLYDLFLRSLTPLLDCKLPEAKDYANHVHCYILTTNDHTSNEEGINLFK